MREIILDTETTGLDPQKGDRLVEIGCLELLNSIPTGQVFHQYIDPQRDVPDEAFRVHGLSREFLAGRPLFADVADDFLEFIGEDRLVIHNAEFDMRFINAELARIGRPPLGMARVVDTLAIARKKHPGASNSLDALCSRYKIDNSRRTKHGALLDSEILADVYCELMGGRQTALVLQTSVAKVVREIKVVSGARTSKLPSMLSPSEQDAHERLVAQIGDKTFWNQYRRES